MTMKMNKKLVEDLYMDGESGYEYIPRIKGLSSNRKKILEAKFPRHPRKLEMEFRDQLDSLKEYEFSYEASRHEKWWLLDSLGPFFDEQWFDDVLKIVKGGKEASVYLCSANPSTDVELIAAKVYRPRSLRNLRKDHLYREGRLRLDSDGLAMIDERQYRAMRNRTSYGQDLMHTSWIEHEFRTMKLLSLAGCNIPKPFASDHNAILMEFIGDKQINAPTLNTVNLDKKKAAWLFDQIISNIKIMLSNERVHGDLSAYNILYWEEDVSIIDFPQAINPNRNPNAYRIFQRDMRRICEYFEVQGVSTNSNELAEDLWTSYGYSTMPNILLVDPDEDQGI